MRVFFMPIRTMLIRSVPVCGILLLVGHALAFTGGVTLYTPYTRISVLPGESIDYAIDVINKTNAVKNADILVTGLPRDWEYELKSGSWKISQISVLPDEKKSLSLRIGVPANVKKGTYRFQVTARDLYALALTVEVSEQGTFKTEFVSRQPNMEGNASSSFTFNAELKNRTSERQLYGLRAEVQRGWNASFKVSGRQVTAAQVESNSTENIAIEIDPPDAVEAGSYKIPVIATTGTTAANIELEVVVKGSYGIELTTPSGLLSTSLTAGSERHLELLVRNSGSSPLENITLTSSAPVNWNVTIEPKKVDLLEAGKTATVSVTIRADNRAIAGDYVTSLEARTPETSSKAAIRVSVRTSVLWGWTGVTIILGVIGGVFALFRKYGRR